MKFGISFRLFLAFAVISSLGIIVSLIAVFSLRSAQAKFNHIATDQLQSFQAAEALVRQTEELARIAPNLYAGRQDNAALIQFSISSYELKSRLQALIGELETTTNGTAEVDKIRTSADKLFALLDRLATSLYERSANEFALRQGLTRSAAELRKIDPSVPE